MAQDPFVHRLVQRADLSVEPMWGCGRVDLRGRLGAAREVERVG
jgi:hypothetical protein